ncbi:MAG TPA: glycosyltransferase family 4 protein [Burkholderiales bacterium]|nr:glycosyltransferase family 4 protein [Burkholderiales bacterium]
MNIVLYRRRVSLTSGAGQLIRMQARALAAAGHRVQVSARRGVLKLLLTSGWRINRHTRAALKRIAASPATLLVDHGAELPEADLVFVHNLLSEGVRYLQRSDWVNAAAQERAFFKALNSDAPVVANSRLVERALVEHFGLSPQRIVVHYPGFDSQRFHPNLRTGALRQRSRHALGLTEAVPLIGFVTSGELDKRGLDVFLDTATRIAQEKDNARFLVVGAKRLPSWAADHRLVSTGRLMYRPKDRTPQRWFAALDLFLFPARFEEFGIVISEAQACGIPVLTSRRVGASECLPPEYDPWIIEAPEADAFAAKVLALLDDPATRAQLAAAGIASSVTLDDRSYVRETVETIVRCAGDKLTGAKTAGRAS